MSELELKHELYAEPDTYQGEVFDDPNRQAVGLEPAWVEGEGGEPGPDGGDPQAAQEAVANGDALDPDDLDELTKDELLAYAQKIGVKPANASMTKDELRDGIDVRLSEG